MAQTVKTLPAVWETWVWYLSWEDPLEKKMVTHSRILAWRITWTEEPDRLQSMGRKELGTTELLSLQFTAPLLLQSSGSRCTGFNNYSTWVPHLQLAGSRAWAQQMWHIGLVLHGMWSLPRPGIKLVSSALASRFLSTAPPGKLQLCI